MLGEVQDHDSEPGRLVLAMMVKMISAAASHDGFTSFASEAALHVLRAAGAVAAAVCQNRDW
jgi:hypothetical protein